MPMATRFFFNVLSFDGVFHQDSSELPSLFGNEVGIGEARKVGLKWVVP